MSKEEYSAWRYEMFGEPYLVWHDGPYFERLIQLEATDPAEVARMLLLGIELEDYVAPMAVQALAKLGRTPAGTEEALRAAIETGTATFLVRVAQALLTITGEQRWSEPVAEVLAYGSDWSERIDAAMALVDFEPTLTLIDALASAVCDREYLVRAHASNTLIRYAGQTDEIKDRLALFRKIGSQSDKHQWEAASDVLTGLARAALE